MSDNANTALIQSMYAAFNSGDIKTVLASVAPDAEWVNYGPSALPYAGDFTGRMEEFFRALGQSVTDADLVVDRYLAAGDTVVAEGRFSATASNTGFRMEIPIAHVFTVRDGKITSWRGYGDTAASLAAHTGKAVSA